MFRDHRTAGAWLPKTMYITRFQESGFTPLAEFDEDVDVTTGIDARRDAQRRQPRHVEGEPADVCATGNDPLNTNARHARLEQPHSRRRHDEVRAGRRRTRSR